MHTRRDDRRSYRNDVGGRRPAGGRSRPDPRSAWGEIEVMRKVLLAGASLLALTAGASSAGATVIGYTGSSTTFTVPTTGTYDIVAFGAQGGGFGGLGAEIGGDFYLTAGEVLTIDVGGQG